VEKERWGEGKVGKKRSKRGERARKSGVEGGGGWKRLYLAFTKKPFLLTEGMGGNAGWHRTICFGSIR